MLNNCNHNDYYQVDIDTPLLEALIYDDHVATYYWGMQLNSLLRAYIDVGPSDYMVENADDDEDVLEYDQNVAKLVAACCNVGFLYLSMPSVTAIHLSSYAMPTFQNLTELQLGDLNNHGWEFLPHLLESAPNLETLVLKRFVEHGGCFAKFESSILNCVPACLSIHLRTIYFEEFNGEQDELELVSYFLTTAEVLRDVEFSFCSSLPVEKQYSTWLKLSSLQRCSKSKNCKIHFANVISMLQSFIEWMKSLK
ncbi:putative F-box protein At5g38390 [Rhododendron vialii]|uniref:putative F-box protein At5g38390 n=1 Tax=Rhododendron vialii TaxID=182163 RepID=UPI00265FB1C8|nr:putative F-box protein At5g38390 [Rhododendron vialii]